MMMMMDQDDTKYVENYIYLGNYKDDDEKKIKITGSIHTSPRMPLFFATCTYSA